MLRTLLFFTLCCISFESFAQLFISPQRLFFEERDRVKEMTIINTTTETRLYRLEWVDLFQNETGKYVPVEEAVIDGKFHSAEPYLRFSPRQVRLGPGERQTIKVLARRGRDMDLTEYRSHLSFTAIPIQQEPDPDEFIDGMRFQLNINVSFRVPIILRTGPGQASFDFNDVNIVPKPSEPNNFSDIVLNWSRSGNISAVGNLTAEFKAQGQDSFEKVGELNGVNFFTDSETINTAIKWTTPPTSKRGELKLTFVDQYRKKGQVLHSETFDIRLPQ